MRQVMDEFRIHFKIKAYDVNHQKIQLVKQINKIS